MTFVIHVSYYIVASGKITVVNTFTLLIEEMCAKQMQEPPHGINLHFPVKLQTLQTWLLKENIVVYCTNTGQFWEQL